MALSTGALTTLVTAKSLLTDKDTVSSTHDLLIEFLIEAYSKRIERYCGRTFERKTYTEEYVGHGRQMLMLKNRPIISVTSIKDSGSLIASTDYKIMSEEGMIYRQSGWTGGSIELGSLALNEPHPHYVRFNLEVIYVAGYQTPIQTGTDPKVPFDLELACARLVIGKYKTRDKEGISRESFEGLSVDFDTFPEDIRAMLDLYKDPK